MGLSCLIDESVQQYCSSCIDARKPVEVGVVVGRTAGGRALVYSLAPTPDQEGSPAATLQQQHQAAGPAANPKKQAKASKGAQPGGGLAIDKEWVVEHAAQVLGMLPGGLDVVGLYLLCPEGSLSAATALLLSLLHETQLELEGGGREFVLLHIDAVTGRLSAREFTGGATGNLRPCELKPSSLLGNMVAVQCRLETAIDVQLTNPKQRLRDVLSGAVAQHVQQRIQPAVGLLAGRLQPAEATLLDAAAPSAPASAAGSSGGEAILPVELLLPLAASCAAVLGGGGAEGLLHRGRGRQEALGALRLSGVLDCRAYLQKRERAAAAVDAIKQDAARTLRARARMLADLAEQQQEEEEAGRAADAAATAPAAPAPQSPPPPPPLLRRAGEVAAPLVLALPRRAFVPGPGGVLCFCDHLLEGEGPETVLGRAQELLGLQQGAPDSVQCLEEVQRHAGKPAGRAAAAGGGPAAGPSLYCSLVTLGALTAAGAALLLGYLAIGQQP